MISTGLLLTRERQIELRRWRLKGKACKKNLGEQPREGETASIRKGMKTEEAHKPTWVHLGESISISPKLLPPWNTHSQENNLIHLAIVPPCRRHSRGSPKDLFAPSLHPEMLCPCSVLGSARPRAMHLHQWHQLKER